MSFWFQKGTSKVIINSQGNVVYCDECPCDDTQIINGCGDPLTCAGGISECWELTVAGVGDFNCSNCSVWNGTFILRYDPTDPSNCIFDSPTFNAQFYNGLICSVETARWRLTRPSGTSAWSIVPLLTSGNARVSWVLGSGVTFDCTGPNTFNRSLLTNSPCNSWPATLTIEPVTCP